MLAGVKRLLFCSVDDVSDIVFVSDGIVGDISTSEWTELNIDPFSSNVKEDKKDDVNGVYYNLSISAQAHGSYLGVVLAEMHESLFIVLVQDNDDNWKLYGLQDFGVRFDNTHNSGKKPGDKTGYQIKFSAKLPVRSSYLYNEDLINEIDKVKSTLTKQLVITGQKGPKGEKPCHRWVGSSIQFQNPDGSWGELKEVKGLFPAHEWIDTSLRIQNPDGSWGELKDLRGLEGVNSKGIDVQALSSYLNKYKYVTEDWVNKQNFGSGETDLSTVWGKKDIPNLDKLRIDADGNLYVPGNVCAFADSDYLSKIVDSLPIASTSSKGIAQFSDSQFTVVNGIVSINENYIGGGLDESALASWLNNHSYATESWVNSKGYLTSHQSLSGLALKEHTHSQYVSSSTLNGYATESWVKSSAWTHSSVPNLDRLTIDTKGNLLVPGNVIAFSDMSIVPSLSDVFYKRQFYLAIESNNEINGVHGGIHIGYKNTTEIQLGYNGAPVFVNREKVVTEKDINSSRAARFIMLPTYVAVRTPNMTKSQYYEFWNSGVGWSSIYCGDIRSQGNVTSTSDMRLKSFKAPLKSVLKNIDELSTFYYYWKDKAKYDSNLHLGLSAQEVDILFPEFVNHGDILSLDYGKLGAVVAIKGLQEVNSWMCTSDKRILELEKQVSKLKNQLKYVA